VGVAKSPAETEANDGYKKEKKEKTPTSFLEMED
tara:strand:+ start:2167 stop:2268 length:102 start_codon:yes stop_codon:yes gene_type:complete